MRVIRRAVEWIDDPTPIALLFEIDGLAGARFFGKDRVTRIMTLDAIDNQTLRCKIGFRHQIEFALVGYFERAAEPLGEQATGVARSLNSEVEQKNSS